MLLGQLDNNTEIVGLYRNYTAVWVKPTPKQIKVRPGSENHGLTLKAAERMAHKNRNNVWRVVATDGKTYLRKGRRNWVMVGSIGPL